MKRILTALCAMVLFAAGATPALAAGSSLPNCYYPISVEEYTCGPLDELRINKQALRDRIDQSLFAVSHGLPASRQAVGVR